MRANDGSETNETVVNEADLDQQLQAAQGKLQDLLRSPSITRSFDEPLFVKTFSDLIDTLSVLKTEKSFFQQTLHELQARFVQADRQRFQLQSILERDRQGHMVTDATGTIHYINQVATALLGISGEEGQGKPLLSCVDHAVVPLLELVLRQLQRSNVVDELDLSVPSAAGVLAVRVKATPLMEQDGQTDHWHWVLSDLTTQKRAESSLQQCLDQERWLNAIAQKMGQQKTLSDILTVAVSAVKQRLQTDRAVIYQVDANHIVIGETETVELADRSQVSSLVPTTIMLQSLADYHVTACWGVDDIEQMTLSAECLSYLRHRQVKAIAATPIQQGNQRWGVLCVQQCSGKRQWQPDELELLQRMAQQIAIAIQQLERYVELERQIQKRTIQVQRALHFESMLKRITDKVRDSLDEGQILQAAVQELALGLGLGGCNAALYNLDQGTSTISYEYTHSIPKSYGRVAQMDHFPEIYRQLQQGFYFQFCSLFPNPMRGPVAMLACPIFVDPASSKGVEQVVLGDLWLIHHQEYVFNDYEIRLVQQVANQCAIAIRQARLYQAAQAQVEALEKLNRLKDEFLSTVSHELRTPITNVNMAIKMLKLASTEERRNRYLDILTSETAREAELIDELLDLQRLEAACYPVSLEVVDLQRWLPDLIDPFRSRMANGKQCLTVTCAPDLPWLTTDPDILRRILTELLNNACKYTAEGHNICLQVDHEAAEGTSPAKMIFQVQNQAEIPEIELPHIFEKFYRVIQSDRYKQGGTGLGLALVLKRVEQLGGMIQVKSVEGWTTFTVTLLNAHTTQSP